MKPLSSTEPRGFTLFIALILASVILAIGISLLDIAYKQVLLASTAKNSIISFYNADSGLECALLADSQDTFNYYTANNSGTFSCQTKTFTWIQSASTGTTRTFTFTIPCASTGVNSAVTIIKSNVGATTIYSDGFNVCDQTSQDLSERGIKAIY